jgi:IMP dehydrogenase
VEAKQVDFIEDRSQPLSSVMTPAHDLITATYPCTLEHANKTLKASKENYLCVVDSDGNLKALTTRADLRKNRDYPKQCKDVRTQSLVVGAAIGSHVTERARAAALVQAGANIIVIDSRMGDTEEQVQMIRWLKQSFPQTDVGGHTHSASSVCAYRD